MIGLPNIWNVLCSTRLSSSLFQYLTQHKHPCIINLQMSGFLLTHYLRHRALSEQFNKHQSLLIQLCVLHALNNYSSSTDLSIVMWQKGMSVLAPIQTGLEVNTAVPVLVIGYLIRGHANFIQIIRPNIIKNPRYSSWKNRHLLSSSKYSLSNEKSPCISVCNNIDGVYLMLYQNLHVSWYYFYGTGDA
jgi:hypothetical protein